MIGKRIIGNGCMRDLHATPKAVVDALEQVSPNDGDHAPAPPNEIPRMRKLGIGPGSRNSSTVPAPANVPPDAPPVQGNAPKYAPLISAGRAPASDRVRLSCDLPKSLHRKLRLHAARLDKTILEVVTGWIERNCPD